ncbi:hypothetical protein EON65_25895 [archaeon]|nr:MAG: hypothetical protein EON65_25895 [archaeon]
MKVSSRPEETIVAIRFCDLPAACFAALGVEAKCSHIKTLVSRFLSEEEINHLGGVIYWQFERLVAELMASHQYVAEWPLSSAVLYTDVLDVRRRGWLLAEDWMARLSEVAPHYAASHGMSVFASIDEHQVGQVGEQRWTSCNNSNFTFWIPFICLICVFVRCPSLRLFPFLTVCGKNSINLYGGHTHDSSCHPMYA